MCIKYELALQQGDTQPLLSRRNLKSTPVPLTLPLIRIIGDHLITYSFYFTFHFFEKSNISLQKSTQTYITEDSL